MRDLLGRVIKALERELGRIEDELELLVQSHARLRAKEKLLRSIKGIGEVRANKILAECRK